MSNNFSGTLVFDRKTLRATIVPQLHKNGMYYEVNIKGFPRFHMAWSQLERFDLVDEGFEIPYQLVLAVSDVIEKLAVR